MTYITSLRNHADVGITLFTTTTLLLLSIFSSGIANASLTAGPDIIPAPLSVIDDAPGAENDHQQAFDETIGVVLPVAVQCDGGGFLPAGAWVDSHMIFLNTEGFTLVSDTQVWTFDGAIVCVMSDSDGNLEAASNAILGAPGTTYPGAFTARGLEGGDTYAVAGNQITVTMQVTEPGDWIRVVTEHVDQTMPEVTCTETVNPSGKNVPQAPAKGGQGQNQDGFYKIGARDDSGDVTIEVVDVGADGILGTADDTAFPVLNGDSMKYTEANGATPSMRAMNGTVDWKIKGQGDAAVVATDAAGNQAVAYCLVPNAPK
jgi:hypothetical protein